MLTNASSESQKHALVELHIIQLLLLRLASEKNVYEKKRNSM